MSYTLASAKAGISVHLRHEDLRHRVHGGRRCSSRLFGCRLGRRHGVAPKHKWLRVHDERRVYQLEKQETANGGAVLNGSRVHGTFGSYSRGSLAKGLPVRAWRNGKGRTVKIYEDNQGSIALAKNPEFHKRTEHIDIRYHFVREKVEDGQVVLQYVSTLDMLADLMTKPIPGPQFSTLRSKLGIMASSAVESSGSVVNKTPRPAAVYR